jgi:hypothetical protein
MSDQLRSGAGLAREGAGGVGNGAGRGGDCGGGCCGGGGAAGRGGERGGADTGGALGDDGGGGETIWIGIGATGSGAEGGDGAGDSTPADGGLAIERSSAKSRVVRTRICSRRAPSSVWVAAEFFAARPARTTATIGRTKMNVMRSKAMNKTGPSTTGVASEGLEMNWAGPEAGGIVHQIG